MYISQQPKVPIVDYDPQWLSVLPKDDDYVPVFIKVKTFIAPVICRWHMSDKVVDSVLSHLPKPYVSKGYHFTRLGLELHLDTDIEPEDLTAAIQAGIQEVYDIQNDPPPSSVLIAITDMSGNEFCRAIYGKHSDIFRSLIEHCQKDEASEPFVKVLQQQAHKVSMDKCDIFFLEGIVDESYDIVKSLWEFAGKWYLFTIPVDMIGFSQDEYSVQMAQWREDAAKPVNR